MMQNRENSYEYYFSRKAYEIGYALFRVAGSISRKTYSEVLERQALSILESVSRGEYLKTQALIKTTDYILNFGKDLGLLNITNAEAICRELETLDATIAEFEKAEKVNRQSEAAIDLNEVFSAALPMPQARQETGKRQTISDLKQNDPVPQREPVFASVSNGSVHVEGNNGGGIVKAAMRQSAILERVRQNGNCRLKDIQEFLPETSERTLRYDIQNLIEKNLIERIGNGGPATYYKVKAQ